MSMDDTTLFLWRGARNSRCVQRPRHRATGTLGSGLVLQYCKTRPDPSVHGEWLARMLERPQRTVECYFPPSMEIVWPLIQPAWSDAKNNTP